MDILQRKNYIGGTDCAGILGLSRYKTALSIWAEKTGNIEIEPSENFRMKMGKKLEQTVVDLFTEETGISVEKVEETIYHPDYNFIAANIDRRIISQDREILECKTCGLRQVKEWDEELIPQEYLLQCYHYLMVTGAPKAYIAVLIGGNEKFVWKEIPADKKLQAEILEKEIYFWQEFVLKNEMPGNISYKDTETLSVLFPEAQKTEIILEDDVNIIIENIDALTEDFNSLKGQIEQQKNELKSKIKENEIGKTGLYEISWRNVHKKEFIVKEQNYRMLRYKKIGDNKNE